MYNYSMMNIILDGDQYLNKYICKLGVQLYDIE